MSLEISFVYIAYTAIYILFAIALKLAINVFEKAYFTSDELIKSGNLAVGLRRAGAQFSLAIAMMGVMTGSASESLLTDLWLTAQYGLLGLIFIMSSLVVTDKLVLPKLDNMKELKRGNLSVGFVEFGMLVATGIIAYASIVGQGGGLVSSLAYFVAGQVTLLLLILIYEKFAHRKINLIESVGNQNISVGLYIGGKLVAYSLILKAAIAGNLPDVGVVQLVVDYLLMAFYGLVLLYIFEVVVDLFIITTAKLSEILERDLLIQVVQLTASKIGVALLLGNVIL